MPTRPICFMIMPYGTKATQQPQGSEAPEKIDFDLLWNAAISKAIDDAGYDPVRADQDIGASIITEMIERLAISDLVVADMSIPNGNVYYEVGVRHAARQSGCVLIAAKWATALFDLNQMRQIRYPLPAEKIDDATAAEIRQILKDGIPVLAAGDSPVWSALPGYPGEIKTDRATSFRNMLRDLSDFQAAVSAARAAPQSAQRDRALALRDTYFTGAPIQTIVALDLLYLLRDLAGWQAMLDFVGTLPQSVSDMPLVREQVALGLSKVGKNEESIGILTALVKVSETSERRGLLGGRYKDLYKASTDPASKAQYLNKAIDNYERGMTLDLNDYYSSSNLAGLYRVRNKPGDTEKAVVSAAVTMVACERAAQRNSDDKWLKPTLLGSAFIAGDVEKAQKLADQIALGDAAAWQLETTISDLERSVTFHTGEVKDGLDAVLTDLKALV